MKNRMKNLFAQMKETALRLFGHAQMNTARSQQKLAETRGDFVMNHAVVFIIIIVVAVVVIGLLIAYVQGDLASLLKGKVSGLFN